MKKLYQNRLLKLANHLENGKLGHDKFDFTVLHCGSTGCAMGELPFIFPKYFSYDYRYCKIFHHFAYLKNPDISWFIGVQEFLGITDLESDILFYPRAKYERGRKIKGQDLKQLSIKATKEQVAKNIKKFVEWKVKQNE